MSKTLYTFPSNPQANKVLVAAKYAGVEVDIAKDFVYGTTNTSAEFLAKFPLGTVPALETSEGVKLTSGNAIAAYVGGDMIAGATTQARAEIQQFVDFADNHIYPAACTWLYPIYGYIQGPRKATPKTEEAVKKVLSTLERVLATRTFLVGNAVTLADISVGLALLPLYRDVLVESFRKPFVNVGRYLATLFAQPHFASQIGAVTFCVKPIAAVAFKGPEKEKKEKKKAPKQEKKKETKKKSAEPTAAELEKAREVADKKARDDAKKKSERIDNLPKSSFVLDEWKRFYSNNEEKDSMKYLEENFDPEGYSLWRIDYKYNDELTLPFMSSNLIGGMFQRCDKLRKYTFASMSVFGDKNGSKIGGVWIMRGQNVLFDELGYNVDSPHYTFTKLDFTKPEDKTVVFEHFSWDGEFKDMGLPFNCGKIYK